MMMMETSLAGAGSAFATLIFLWSVFRQYAPYRFDHYLTKHFHRIFAFVYPYIHIKIPEYSGERMKRSEAYAAIESYLISTCSKEAKRLKADLSNDTSNPTLSMDDYEEVTDQFNGAKFWWTASTKTPTSRPMFSWYPQQDEHRYYLLSFHRRHRELVVNTYLNHVIKQGREISTRNRQRKLYTNNASENWYGYKKSVWSHVVFEHPATFETVGMDPSRKKEIMDDLNAFKNGKDYYNKIGKAWKRGYLLHGPPGTGKSTMIAAIANFMDYDIYDLELTSVKNNTDLRKLFIETTSKSIIVIEDIDCSVDLTGKRKAKKEKEEDEDDKKKPPGKGKEEKEESKITLSGLLNFIDGLWSACGGERLIIFTTNHLEKLDPALIRRGRMDKHIEMSYCSFEAFKVLAGNYLDLEEHALFGDVKGLLDEVKMTPADVAENLMHKCVDRDVDVCIGSLIKALEEAKEEAAKAVEAKAEEISEDEDVPKKNISRSSSGEGEGEGAVQV